MANIVYSTVNSFLKTSRDENTLAEIKKSGEMPSGYFAHMCAFFTERIKSGVP